jgi:ABC-type transport system substrate-binding protein
MVTGVRRRSLAVLSMLLAIAAIDLDVNLDGPWPSNVSPWPPMAFAQDKPRYGGELIFAVPAEPPSYDGHREGTFAMVHPVAPHYNTLLRPDPNDRTGAKIVPDLGESWTTSQDGRTYTIKLRRGVKFHDGAEMTSRDVKASYDRIIWPPAGVTSFRRAQYTDIEAVETPDADTVVFRLKWPSASFLNLLASPYGWIYKADILAKDQRWYEKNVMGTGPFTFVEYAKGSHWIGKKNPNYWDKGKPYLDTYRAIFIRDNSAQVAAVRAERAHGQFRYKDPVLDDLYQKQSRAMDPDERKKYVREFEKRLLDEEAHYVYTLQWYRIVPHSAKLRGWTITPSHFLNQQLDVVWLAE